MSGTTGRERTEPRCSARPLAHGHGGGYSAGARANRALAHALDGAGVATIAVDDLSIELRRTATLDAITAVTDAADPATLRPPVEPRRLDAIKFALCVPDAALQRMISERDADEPAVTQVLREPIRLASR